MASIAGAGEKEGEPLSNEVYTSNMWNPRAGTVMTAEQMAEELLSLPESGDAECTAQ